MKLLPLSLMLALSLVGCGKKASEKKPKRPNDVSNTFKSQFPIRIESDRNKSLCSITQYEDAHRNMNLSLFLRGEMTDADRFFSGLIEGLLVRDVGAKIITETHKGEDYQINYVITDNELTGNEKVMNSSASTVSVCPDDGKYARGSAESAALNANYFIAKTNRKVSQLLPDVKIAPISVEIAPVIKETIQVIVSGEVVYKNEAYSTDNAYYMPGANSITFLPHSEEGRSHGYTMNFWEVPMVASHEYGHHIFETLHPSVMPATGLKNCFGRMRFAEETEELEAREVTNDDVLGALNEGFADLISYYSLENDERGLKGVPCLQIARDVGINEFADKTPKVFSAKALSDFFADKEIERPKDCSIPNYQDIHIIGAVFANGADRLLSLSADTKDKRLLVTLKWLQEMKAKSSTMNSLRPADFLRESFKLLIETTAALTDGKVDQQECDIAKEVYPGIDGYLEACRPPM